MLMLKADTPITLLCQCGGIHAQHNVNNSRTHDNLIDELLNILSTNVFLLKIVNFVIIVLLIMS